MGSDAKRNSYYTFINTKTSIFQQKSSIRCKRTLNFHLSESLDSPKTLFFPTKSTAFSSARVNFGKSVSKGPVELVPIVREINEKKRTALLEKSKGLQCLIDEFLESRTGATEKVLDRIDGSKVLDVESYMRTLEDCCGDEVQTYKKDTDKNLMIEKFRIGSYRRRLMRSIF